MLISIRQYRLCFAFQEAVSGIEFSNLQINWLTTSSSLSESLLLYPRSVPRCLHRWRCSFRNIQRLDPALQQRTTLARSSQRYRRWRTVHPAQDMAVACCGLLQRIRSCYHSRHWYFGAWGRHQYAAWSRHARLHHRTVHYRTVNGFWLQHEQLPEPSSRLWSATHRSICGIWVIAGVDQQQMVVAMGSVGS